MTAEPFQQHGPGHVVVRSGDLVRRVNERWADDYMLVADWIEVQEQAAPEWSRTGCH